MRLVTLLTVSVLAFITAPAAAGGDFAINVSFGSGWRSSRQVVAVAPVACAPVQVAPVVCATQAPVIVQSGWRGGRHHHRGHRHGGHEGPRVVVTQPVVVHQQVVCSHPIVVAPAAPVIHYGAPVHGRFVQASHGWRR